jgi:hypothetical protein
MSTPPPPPGTTPPPPYGGPPPGYTPYGPGNAAAGKYSGMSIAGFVLSLVGTIPCFWILQLPGLLGTIFGFIGLRQTKDGSRRGKGLAIAAVVIGLVLLVLAAILILYVATSDDCEFRDGRFECRI